MCVKHSECACAKGRAWNFKLVQRVKKCELEVKVIDRTCVCVPSYRKGPRSVRHEVNNAHLLSQSRTCRLSLGVAVSKPARPLSLSTSFQCPHEGTVLDTGGPNTTFAPITPLEGHGFQRSVVHCPGTPGCTPIQSVEQRTDIHVWTVCRSVYNPTCTYTHYHNTTPTSFPSTVAA